MDINKGDVQKNHKLAHFCQHVMPFVHHMPEVLIIELISFVAPVEARGSEDGQESRVIAAFLRSHNNENKISSSPMEPR